MAQACCPRAKRHLLANFTLICRAERLSSPKSIYGEAPVTARPAGGRHRPAASGRRPTIHDVARSAAVSPATVSNVLTGRRPVDPELASRVLASVDALGY